jgi:TonB-linked SusC/RagA family outer membrane protein
MLFEANCHPAVLSSLENPGCTTPGLPGIKYSFMRWDLVTKKRVFMRLNLLFFLMTAIFLNVCAKGVSQELSFKGTNVPLTRVFSVIKKQTGYVVFYDNNLLKKAGLITLDLKNVTVEELLAASLMYQDLDFVIIDKTILLKKKALPQVVNSTEIEAPPFEVTGRIVNEEGDPLVGVTVMMKGTQFAVVTNDKGIFTIEDAGENRSLIISYVGYETQEVELNGKNILNLVMKLSQKTTMGEVVVTALGISRTSRSLTYSVQEVSGTQVNEVRETNIMNSLDGKIAGLQVSQSNSGPGGATRVILRGNRSIQNSNNALIVVDGVAIDNSLPHGNLTGDGGYNSLDGAANINPDDVQSVTVLKGASAAALYGSRAANGVIMITTKKGRSGKMQVDLNSGVANESVMLMPSLQNTYEQGAGGLASPDAVGSWGAKGGSIYPDNINDLFRNALSVNNAIGITAGQEKIQGYFSYANNYTEGIIPLNNLKRNTLNLRISTNPFKGFSTDLKVTYVDQDVENLLSSGEGSPLGLIYRAPRSVSTEQMEDISTEENGREKHNYWISSSLYTNPYWSIYRNIRNVNRNRITLLGSAKYAFTSWLNLQFRYSLDKYNDYGTANIFDGSPNTEAGGRYQQNDFAVSERNIDLLLSGVNSIGRSFKVNYNIGGSLLGRNSGSNKLEAIGLQVPNKFNINFATNLTAVNSYIESELQSVYGTAQLSFRDYLFLDVTGRNDWSSTLPSPHNYFYPSIGLSAVVSDIVSLPSAIDFAKVRISYSQVGNDAIAYLLNPVYNFSQGGNLGFIIRSSSQPIPDLKPEKTTSLEAGAEFRFLDSRFSADVTYYKTNSVNQLLNLAISPVSGYLSKYLNAGDIQNAGWEISLHANAIQTDRFNWNIAVNYARNRSKVLALSEEIKESSLFTGFAHVGTVKVVEGGAYGDVYAYGWAKNENGEYVVNSLGLPKTTDYTKVGNFNPDYMLGISNSFSLGNWAASFLINGKVGGVVLSGTQALLAGLGNSSYTENYRDGNWVLDGVMEDGSKNNVSITSEQFWNAVGGSYSQGGFFAYDATNFRIGEASLGYSFQFKENHFIKAAKLSFVSRNLLFLYRGNSLMDIPGIGKRKLQTDPEIIMGTGNMQGIEFINLPPTRSVGLNLKISF